MLTEVVFPEWAGGVGGGGHALGVMAISSLSHQSAQHSALLLSALAEWYAIPGSVFGTV